jgi:DMSO/TMAO reductase YedYZ molybdopterin-dependent catalytic subunit
VVSASVKPEPAEPSAERGSPVGRRVVLGMLGAGALGIVAGAPVSNALNRVEAKDPTGLAQLLPAGGGFRYYSITGGVKNIQPADYTLTVGGLVDQPITLTYADLAGMKQTELVKDFQCVTGWRVPQVHWRGVLLRDVIAKVKPKSTATALRFLSFDGGDAESLTMEQAQRGDILVALEMLGKPVTHEHGGPVRLYVAPMYGYKSLKWLSGIELTAKVEPGFWEGEGYDVDAWVGKSNGLDDAKID